MVNVALTHDRRCTCRAARPPAVLICSIFIRVESSLIDRARGERKVGAKILNFDLPTDFRPENRTTFVAPSRRPVQAAVVVITVCKLANSHLIHLSEVLVQRRDL